MSILHEIKVPDLNSTNYIENIQTQVNNINNNFEILQSLDYLKGEDGAALYIENISLNTDTKWKQKIKECILKIDETSQNEITDTISGNHYNAFYDLDNNDNILCLIYKIENDERVYISSLAYTFLDSRFTHINDINTNVNNMNQTYSHIYGDMLDCSRILIYNGTRGEFEAVQSFPTLYYDENNGFCWNIYGNQSGLPSQGVPGVNGKNGNLYIVKIEYFDGDNVIGTDDTQMYSITHYYKNSIDNNGWENIEDIPEDINGCNCIALANNNTGTEQKLWVSMIQGDKPNYKVFCEDENSLRYNLNASFLKELLSTINVSNNDGPKGYFLKFNEEPRDQKAHMIYAVKDVDDTDYNNLIISPVSDYNNPENILEKPTNSVGENLVLNYKNIKLYKDNKLIDIDKYIANITRIEYEDLVKLRNKSELVPGKEYRIIDYVTTTAQEHTQSKGNLFDVIVTADNEYTLNEVARAIQRDEDTYFDKSDLNAWQIWYSLDNDTSRFAWAVPTSEGGKGVIYRMIDEWGNDCPYDFKNIQFTIDSFENAYTFGAGSTDYSTSVSNTCKNNKLGKFFESNNQKLNFILFGRGCSNNTIGSNCNNIYFSDRCNNINIQDNYRHQLNSSFDKYDNTHNNTNIISGDKILFNNTGVTDELDRFNGHKTALLLGNNNNIVLSDDAAIQHCTRGKSNENMTSGADPYSNAVTTIAWTHNGSKKSNGSDALNGTGYENDGKYPPHIGFVNELSKNNTGVWSGTDENQPGRINICPYSTPSDWWTTYNYGLSMSKDKLYYEGQDILYSFKTSQSRTIKDAGSTGNIWRQLANTVTFWGPADSYPQFDTKPGSWGMLFTFSSEGDNAAQIWHGQPDGDLCHRGMNSNGISNWRRVMDDVNCGSWKKNIYISHDNTDSSTIRLNNKNGMVQLDVSTYLGVWGSSKTGDANQRNERWLMCGHKDYDEVWLNVADGFTGPVLVGYYRGNQAAKYNAKFNVNGDILIENNDTNSTSGRQLLIKKSNPNVVMSLYVEGGIGRYGRGLYNDSNKNWFFYTTEQPSSSAKTFNINFNGNTVSDISKCTAGGFYQSSDSRLKDFEDTIPVDLEKLRALKKNYFTWKDKENKDRQIGVSAQEIQEIYPELVSANEDGMLSVAYDKLSVVALAAIDKLYDENQSLKRIISDFNERLNKLEQNGNRN